MNRLCLLGIVLLLTVCASAVAATSADLLVPLGVAPFDFEFGELYHFYVVDSWQGSLVEPGDLLALDFDPTGGVNEYVSRLRMELGPVSLSVGDYVHTQTGGAGGEGTGQSYTYDGLVGTFRADGTVREHGRILLETDPRFQAWTTPQDYFRTGYNPDAWANWLASQDQTTGWYPITNRLMIVPVINTEGLTGSSQVEVLGFATFFLDRVWDGITVDPATGLIPTRGDMQVRFIPGAALEPIPEPSGLLVLGGGMLALAGMIRRRRSAIREDAARPAIIALDKSLRV